MRLVIDLTAGLLLASVSVMAVAQQLRDPTRPPLEASAKPAAAKSGSRGGLVLQTVLISPERKTAVISGRVMSVGDTVSGFRLTEIREGEVVMKGSKGRRTLRLYPAVSKVEASAALSEGNKGLE
jgi:hypothetical protein